MQPKLVADVRDECFFRRNLLDQYFRILQVEMCEVFLFPECIYDKIACSFYLFDLLSGDITGIGNVGNVFDPETEDRKPVMEDPDRNNLNPIYLKWLVFDRVEIDPRNTRVPELRKHIGKFPPDRRLNPFFGIDIHWFPVYEIECPDIIHSGNMIFMLVGEQDGIQLLHPCPQHLLPEIRARIDDYGLVIHFNKDGTAQP